jgi:serine/threonine protein kinase
MAVKVLQIPNENKRAVVDDLQREIDLMRTLKHPNIVRYLGAEVDSLRNILNIFQEWVPGGCISTLLKKFGPFSINVVKSYLAQILDGLDYLHCHGIIHRDIKVRLELIILRFYELEANNPCLVNYRIL